MGDRVSVEQRVEATPERAFDAWLSADALAAWWWPHIPDTTYAIEARPGGSYAIRSEAAGIGVEGELVAIERPHRLRLTWRWLDDGVAQVEEPVSVAFAPEDDGTRVVVEHDLADASRDGDGIRQGWASVLGRLAEQVARD